MSYVDKIISGKPGKYETLIESRVLAKQLEMKIKQYNSTQDAYDKLIQSETINRKPASGGNENINGRLKQISAAGKDWLWGVNSSDAIWTCKKPCTDSNWKQIGGSLKQLTGGDKEVWGVNSVNNIYKMNQDHSNNWKYIPGKLDNISQGGGWVWGVNSSHNVYRCKQPCDGKWILDTAPTTDEWTLVFRQTNNNWNWTTNNGGNRNIDKGSSSSAANYSQLQNLENFRGADGKLTFKMTYPKNKTLTSPQIWKQTSNPWTVRNNRNGQVDGYQAISVPYTGDAWGGLRWNGGPCLLSGSTNAWWWYALGSFKPFGNNLIPGANNIQVNKTELYVKNKKNSNQGPSLVQLSCSNTHVYGIDTAKRAWIKNIDGSGEWTQFGNPNNRPDLTGKWSYINMQGGSVLPIRCNPSKTNSVLCAAAAGATADQQGCGWGQYSASTPVTTPYTYETGCPGWADTSGKGVCEKLNCDTLGFSQINASSSNGKVLAIGTDGIIYETDKNGTAPWKRSASAGGASGISTVSGDSQNEDFYFTNTNDQIYRNSPITSGGSWTDIKNDSYAFGQVGLKQSNDNWKYLGQTNNIDECKLKAVEDKDTIYSSIVYTTGNGGADKTCLGGVKGGTTNPMYVSGVTTSLAPNGSSRLGGQEGETLLNQMKKIQTEIKSLIDQSKEDNIGLEKTTNLLNTNKKQTNNELSNLLDKLAQDRKKINKLLLEPDAIGEEEDSDFRQQSNYSVYFLWILLVIVSLVLASHIIGSPSESISPIAYVFVSIWILIFAKYYYKQAASYGVAFWNYISAMLVDPL